MVKDQTKEEEKRNFKKEKRLQINTMTAVNFEKAKEEMMPEEKSSFNMNVATGELTSSPIIMSKLGISNR